MQVFLFENQKFVALLHVLSNRGLLEITMIIIPGYTNNTRDGIG